MKDSAIDRLGEIQLFCAAAKAQSFTGAAAAAGVTPSAISKAVGRLENRLGLLLFHRTTRAVRLTDDGLVYYDACRLALENIQETEHSLTAHGQPRGELKISVPPSYGIKHIVPLIPQYVERYDGKVEVVVSLSNAVADFATQDFDMTIRLGQVADSRLVGRLLHNAQLRVVASPEYLRRHPAPARPEALRDHVCLGFVMPDSGRPLPWSFAEEAKTAYEIPVRPAMTFDHPFATLACAVNGGGVTQLFDFTVEDDLRDGRLVEVLAQYRPLPQPIFAVYPTNRHLSAKVRTFVDFLLERQRAPGRVA
ncbi:MULTISPECIES: LysR family transcriptional regulator [unclassified Caballeronia]|uniref:LysR family transcriptional regulator n=1 Tax=unclassified Caballeronia TaxID=2646786 RepID=UPI001F36E1A2|nr:MULTISPECIES: LysR family transcriptional regulator [unclassified Caballeronia]MCE4545895.1 LysR family transcriptional regulator [Caballeronia sp. PC1]MCE4571983.1 LysR family transcriptional regulator [Caballeronia sp. CLC5]